MRKRLNTLAVATLLALPAAANAYSHFYFFGDSLTDTGAFGGLGGLPSTARWTLGYGTGWAEVLANHYGQSVSPNNGLNTHIANTAGNNYAQGDARAQPASPPNTNPETPSQSPAADAIPVTDLPGQINAYLGQKGQKADPNAAYAIWIGGNDVIAAGSQSNPTAYLGASAGYTAQAVAALKAAGANTIILPNLPDISAAPLSVLAAIQTALPGAGNAGKVLTAWGAAWEVLSAGQTSNSPALINQALSKAETTAGLSEGTLTNAYAAVQPNLQKGASGYNQLVDMALSAGNLQHGVVRANISGLFSELLANPRAYGFSNTSGAACSQSALYCLASVIPGQNYLFTDALHPTPAAYQLIGDYIYGLLQAPYFAGALPESALNNARQLGGTLDSRYQAIRAQKREVGAVSAFVSGAFNDDKIGYDSLSAKPQGRLYTVGLDFQASPALSLGLAMSRQNGKTDINGIATPGSVDDRSTLMSALFSYKQERFWLDGDAHIGAGDIDTRRQVSLGAAQIALNGTARQSQYGVRVGGGYLIPLGAYHTGPIAGLDYAHVKVNGFTEQGGNSSSMAFNAQNGTSLVARVGWQLEADIGRFSPYAKLSYAHEFKRDDRIVTAGLATTLGDYSVKLGKPKADWLEWTAGLSAQLSKSVSMFGQLSAASGRSGSSQTAGNVGVALTF
ncbi:MULTISPECIES: autotransporter outer membrane beta-barrel domain-containing protein [Chromobacterium]|uniref:autotransporter outer membrane beta-barrel domain-containing protein n=1 Tax=Chromobacterium TaxID=535 RepID=UPI0018883384|nr:MULTISPECIES: autotransporter domain-containing protein [Chromobacterium]QOZ82868.1 autotransporter domain-containing protein [Chromobacterium sp. Rain0013]WON82941.1 autotransporter domain-containing protein [Chromobacterium haemolyticum]